VALFAPVALLCLVGPLPGAHGADERTEAFKPVDRTPRSLVFQPRRVDGQSVVRASVSYQVKRGGKDVRRTRRVPASRVRQSLERDKPLKVFKPLRAKGGKLLVRARPTRPPAAGDPSACALDPATMTAAACRTTFTDTVDGPDASSLWGKIDCAAGNRHQVVGGGDPHPTASGAAQPSANARQLTVVDGDDVWGERCELGENWRPSTPMPLYTEGQRRITFVSFRLPHNYPLGLDAWQTVMQMKQIQPAANGGGTPVLALKAYDGIWSLVQSTSNGPSDASRQLWSAPASAGTWTRFAFDVTYSSDPSVGSVTVYVDLNGDGDALDAREKSPTFKTYTLKVETSGGSATDGVAAGSSIPGQLRVGIYHDPDVPCPASVGCANQVDNVQIVSP
jgi:Polysaccharide lyase